MKNLNDQMQIGSRVRLKEDHDMPGYMFFRKGHEFVIDGSSYRGFDMIDDKGNRMDETLFIEDKFELCQ